MWVFRKSKKRKKDKDEPGSSKKPKVVVDEDAVAHGGWWAAKTAADITGTVSIEFGDRCYLKALDNGYRLSSIFNELKFKSTA